MLLVLHGTDRIAPLNEPASPTGLLRVTRPRPRPWCAYLLALAVLLASARAVDAASSYTRRIDGDLSAQIMNGKRIYLLARVRARAEQQAIAYAVMTEPDRFARYVKSQGLRVPLHRLNDEYRREVTERLFRHDRSTRTGWRHRVTYADNSKDGGESLWRIAEWFTGAGPEWKEIAAYNNRSAKQSLRTGDIIVIPDHLLLPAYRERPTPAPLPLPAVAPDTPYRLTAPHGDLLFREDARGPYAAYKLRRGETLYTDVAIRFCGRVKYRDVMDVAHEIARRSSIANVNRIAPGRTIKIPLELLAPDYLPRTDPERRAYEQARAAASVYFSTTRRQNLRGITVILDSGHGGADPGAIGPQQTYEDEVCYDVVVRVQRILQDETAARVVLLVQDRSQGFRVTDRARFSNDKDEILLTTPPYAMTDAKTSVNLRWYLANSIYRRALADGATPDEVVFTSFHADALHPAVNGAMVYIPGARYTRGPNGRTGRVYTKRAEVREAQYVKISRGTRIRNEGHSRNFARLFISNLQRHRLPIHKDKPVRAFIYRGRRRFVPGVIRQTLVPTKVLVELVNLKNAGDAARIRNPEFRERFARAYVDTVLAYYDATPADSATTVAQTP